MFPAGRDALAARLADMDMPGDLMERVATLPAGARFGTSRDVLVALGINSPETEGEPGG
ncbi:MAG TPA: hypothetical protein VF838_09230 [Trebonia sp.]